jgi:hypothetical protein
MMQDVNEIFNTQQQPPPPPPTNKKKLRNKGLDLWVPLKKVKVHMEYNFFG